MLSDSVWASASIAAESGTVWRFLTVNRATWWRDKSFEATVGLPLNETWMEDGQASHATGIVKHCLELQLLAFS